MFFPPEFYKLMISKSFFEHFHRHRSSWLKPAQNRTNRWSWKWQPLPESIANQYEVVDSSLSWLETHPWHLGRSWWWDHNGEMFVGWKIKCFDSEESSSKRLTQPLEICSCRVDSIYGGRVEKGILRDWLLDNLFWSSRTWGQKKRSTTTTTSYKPQWGPLYSQHDFCSCRLTSWSSSPRATQTKGSVLKTNKNKLES